MLKIVSKYQFIYILTLLEIPRDTKWNIVRLPCPLLSILMWSFMFFLKCFDKKLRTTDVWDWRAGDSPDGPPPLTVAAPGETSDALKKFIILELILILN